MKRSAASSWPAGGFTVFLRRRSPSAATDILF
jgi:hypothetical protein